MNTTTASRLCAILLTTCVVAWDKRDDLGIGDEWFQWGASDPGGGYAIFGRDGKLIETLPFPRTVGRLDPTPDRSGYFRHHVTMKASGTSTTLSLRVAGHEVSLLGGENTRVVWTSADGSSLFLQEGDDLAFWSLCSGAFRKVPIERRVGAWSVSATHLYLSRRGVPRQIIRRSLFGSDAGISVELPNAFDQIFPTEREDSVLVSDSTHGNPARLTFWSVDLRGRRSRPLSLPEDVWVVDALSAPAGSALLLEVWKGQATYADGVPVTDFGLWNYQTAAFRNLFRNPHGLRPFAGRKNFVRIPPRCD